MTAYFLVSVEFRRKARQVLTTREIQLCVVILFLAMVNWSYVLGFIFGAGSTAGRGRVHMPGHFYGEADPPPGDFEGAETHCNPKFPKTCVGM